MGVRTSSQVIISCDGRRQKCPSDAQFRAGFHISASMRLAGQAGWTLEDLALCPDCSAAGTACHTSSLQAA